MLLLPEVDVSGAAVRLEERAVEHRIGPYEPVEAGQEFLLARRRQFHDVRGIIETALGLLAVVVIVGVVDEELHGEPPPLRTSDTSRTSDGCMAPAADMRPINARD